MSVKPDTRLRDKVLVQHNTTRYNKIPASVTRYYFLGQDTSIAYYYSLQQDTSIWGKILELSLIHI